MRADFEAKVHELLDDRLGTRLEALADRRQREVERRNRARVDTLLAVIAAAGISGVVQIVQAGLNWGAGEAVAAAGLIVAVAAGIGMLVRISAQSR